MNVWDTNPADSKTKTIYPFVWQTKGIFLRLVPVGLGLDGVGMILLAAAPRSYYLPPLQNVWLVAMLWPVETIGWYFH